MTPVSTEMFRVFEVLVFQKDRMQRVIVGHPDLSLIIRRDRRTNHKRGDKERVQGSKGSKKGRQKNPGCQNERSAPSGLDSPSKTTAADQIDKRLTHGLRFVTRLTLTARLR
jgi:hypothetical protein